MTSLGDDARETLTIAGLGEGDNGFVAKDVFFWVEDGFLVEEEVGREVWFFFCVVKGREREGGER